VEGGACLGMDWGILLVFSCRELLFYSAVVRLHSGVLGRDWVSLNGGDGWWMVMVRGLGMGKAITGLFLHGYMLNLVWVELEEVQVGSGGQLYRWMLEVQDAREAEAHRPMPTGGLGVGRYSLLGADERWGECQRRQGGSG
jgi:hypothetical protein